MLGRVALQCGRHATRTAARQSHPWGVGVRGVVTTATTASQWVDEPMAEAQFTRMREIIGAPSPVNLEVCRVGWYVGWWRVLGGGHEVYGAILLNTYWKYRANLCQRCDMNPSTLHLDTQSFEHQRRCAWTLCCTLVGLPRIGVECWASQCELCAAESCVAVCARDQECCVRSHHISPRRSRFTRTSLCSSYALNVESSQGAGFET